MKRTLAIGFVALASLALLFAQGEKKILVQPSIKVPPGSHSMEEAYLRFQKLMNSLGLSEPQKKNVTELWHETAARLKTSYDVKKMEGARGAPPAQGVLENAEKRLATMLTKMQRNALGELLRAQSKASAKPAEAEAKLGAPTLAKVKCWSCWPGECDRKRGSTL